MIKLILTLIMLFTFGTSTVNAEENTTSIENRINELAEIKSDSESAIKAKIDELSEDELKAIIENVNELKEPTEEDLAIKEAATNKLEEMERELKTTFTSFEELERDYSLVPLLFVIGVVFLIFFILVNLGRI